MDELIDQNIQINSNKEIRGEYLYRWTLKFRDGNQETKYCQLREDMFRSNMLCVYVVWIFIVLCQVVILPTCITLVICLGVATLLLTVGCILVMAEEFTCKYKSSIFSSVPAQSKIHTLIIALPYLLQKRSAALVNHRNRRTTFICAVIIIMSAASCIGLAICPMANSEACITEQIAANKEFQLNVFVSATIHHNITINSAAAFQSTEDNRTNGTSTVAPMNLNNNWQSLLPNDVAFIRRELHKSLIISDKSSNDPFILTQDNSAVNTMIANEPLMAPIADEKDPCSYPQYIVFTWVLCLIALATGLKLYYLVKTFMAFIMVFCYATLILFVIPRVFEKAKEDEEHSKDMTPLGSQMVILLVIFLTMVTYHARLVEVTSRLDFIWKEQAEKELANMKSNRNLNDVLIKVSADICKFFKLFEAMIEK